MRKQNTFHMMYDQSTLRLDTIEYVYPKISDAVAYRQSKQAVKSASDYIETRYSDVRIFMQQTQCNVFIRHFNDG